MPNTTIELTVSLSVNILGNKSMNIVENVAERGKIRRFD